MKDAAAILKECDLFSGLGEEARAVIAGHTMIRDLEKGRILFREGDRAEGLYIVGSGKIKVFKTSPDGREHILHVFTAGALVAEAAVFERGTFPATAEALERSRILFLYKKEFLRLLKENPDLILAILGDITRKLREFAATIEELSLKDVPARLARYLVANSRDVGGRKICRLGITKSQLAARLGTANETLSRTLGKLKLRGMIAETAEGIVLRDEKGLAALAETGLK